MDKPGCGQRKEHGVPLEDQGNISAGEKDEWRTGQLSLVLWKVGLELRGSILYPCGGQRVEAAVLAESKEELQ